MTELLLNLLSCIVVGIALNVISFVKFRIYLKSKRREEMGRVEMKMIPSAPPSSPKTIRPRSTTINSETINCRLMAITPIIKYKRKPIRKELNELQVEKTMFYMILTLCSISIVTRVCNMCCIIIVLNFPTFSNRLVLMLITLFNFTLLPNVSLFIFCGFDRTFRNILQKMCSVDEQGRPRNGQTSTPYDF